MKQFQGSMQPDRYTRTQQVKFTRNSCALGAVPETASNKCSARNPENPGHEARGMSSETPEAHEKEA